MTNIIGEKLISTAYQIPRNTTANSATSSQEDSKSSCDTLTLNTASVASGVYTKSASTKVDTSAINKLKQEFADASENLRAYVAKLIQNQGNEQSQAPSAYVVNQAKQAVSEDGDWGVKAVSDRIVEFAKAISGNDKSKIDTLKAAIEKGFKEAGVDLGGTLPDISKQTHDEIMKKLDEWANEGQNESE